MKNLSDYSEFSLSELINKISTSRYWNLPKMLAEALRRLVPKEPKYKVYTALLTQSGTDAPVATVLENTLGGEVVWSYSDVGNYFGSISNEGFVNDKTIGFVSNNASAGRYVLIDVYGLIPDQIALQIKNSITNLSIDGISGQPIEIRVYN